MTDTSLKTLNALSPVILDDGVSEHMLPASDDGSAGPVPLGFPVNFFGTVFTSLYVNTNGNVTFDAPLYTYQPMRLSGPTPPIIAPFLADVDTRSRASGRVRYGATTFEGRAALGVNWLGVGYQEARADKLNSFQLLLVERGDEGFGDFDIIMNYDTLVWESGEAAGGHEGLGGLAACAGLSAGTGEPDTFFEFPGSRVNGALLDTDLATGLTQTRHHSDMPGRHIFQMRKGRIVVGEKSAGRGRKLMPSAVLLSTGKVLAFGDFVPTADLFDPHKDEWEATGDSNFNRRRHTATLLPDGRVLVTGGDDNPSSAELYDPSIEQGLWRGLASMSAERSRHTATLVQSGGRSMVLVMGGEDPSGNPLSSVELYDPDMNTWKELPEMRTARSGHTATRVQADEREYVLVTGGEVEAGKPLDLVELYDVEHGSSDKVDSMKVARQAHTATLLVGGQVLVAGGESPDFGNGASGVGGTAEVFDPKTRTWSFVEGMALPRRDHAAFALRTGEVIVCGGAHELTGYQNGLEMYAYDRDSGLGKWLQLASMHVRRKSHAALQLGDGRILIVGGFTSPADLQGTYELYPDPRALG